MRNYEVRLLKVLEEKLKGKKYLRLVEAFLATFSECMARKETVFFRDYTDHGAEHVERFAR